MLSTGSTSKAWKMAKVATGSTAEMSEPKAKLWTKLSGYTTSAWPRMKIPPPTIRAEIVVPTMAKSRILPMFVKKLPEKEDGFSSSIDLELSQSNLYVSCSRTRK